MSVTGLPLLSLVAVFGCAPSRERTPAPTRPSEHVEQGPSADLRRVLTDKRVPRLNADGTRADPPLTPVQAAAMFGGLIMLAGGLGSFALWRRSGVEPVAEHGGVVRNSAGPPGSLR